jgi:hypothetical protein
MTRHFNTVRRLAIGLVPFLLVALSFADISVTKIVDKPSPNLFF